MLPSGEPILRPPANALPPGAEWQDTQSAARARYSPGLLGGLVFSSARAVAAPAANSASSPQSIVLEIVVTSRASPAGITPVTSANGRRRSRRPELRTRVAPMEMRRLGRFCRAGQIVIADR